MNVKTMAKYLLILLLIPLSCGTVHQMMPPTPLKYHENRVDFIATYDLNNLDLVPDFDMAFYWGVGKNCNLGFGFSHVSIAKYFDNDQNHGEYVFLSVGNVPIPMRTHPNFEFGGGLTKRNGEAVQSFSAGFWLLFNESHISPLWFYPLWLNLHPDSSRTIKHLAGGPFIKYQYYRRNVGFSLQNYLGLTALNLKILRSAYLGRDSTIIFSNADIDSIYCDSLLGINECVIRMDNGKTYLLSIYSPYDKWFPDMDIIILDKYKCDDYTQAYFFLARDFRYHIKGTYEANIKQMIDDYENGKDIVLAYDPDITEKIIKRIRWYKSDWSIGVRWMK